MTAGLVRLGLAGVGRWGRNYVRTIGGMSDAVLTAVASGNPETASLVPPNCRVVAQWSDLLAVDVDGIIIATPPATHAAILLAAVAAGKPVLVEKPLVTTAADLDALAAVPPGAVVMVEHTHLFHPAFRALKREVAARGRPLSIRSSAGNAGPYRPDVSVLWDWGPHDIAMALDLVPGPAAVTGAAVLEQQPVDGAVAERLRIGLDLDGGVSCDIMLSTLGPRHRWFAVDYDDCTLIYVDPHETPLRHIGWRGAGPTEAGTEIRTAADRPLTVAVREFVSAVRDGGRSCADLTLALRVVNVLLRCEREMADDRPVL
ncbi:MAG TPA: Gfo/Idh/MocA family oxidoreductase [Methyloceanibacter sp.]|nr:Gfo/Idh/MocA family oxidoreductase [Methyloceanibacter sp.]